MLSCTLRIILVTLPFNSLRRRMQLEFTWVLNNSFSPWSCTGMPVIITAVHGLGVFKNHSSISLLKGLRLTGRSHKITRQEVAKPGSDSGQ